MGTNWFTCKNILIIRPDNMGDLIMSGPAIRALKETFKANITVLTSSIAAPIAELMDETDEVISFDFPWVKNNGIQDNMAYIDLVEVLLLKKFDGAVIFTVYSQNPMPSIMLAYMAGIPNRLAYCRENPYQLLTDWVPDEEPYTFIRHQVKRDIDLVAQVGARIADDKLHLKVNSSLWHQIERQLVALGFDPAKKWLIIHAGVSELKREFSTDTWVKTAKKLIDEEGFQIILTGSKSEKLLTDLLQQEIGQQSFSTGGLFSLDELITLISSATVMLSVNTGTIHIAAAVGTPVMVLYALTNPQHTPWKVANRILPYQVSDDLHSKNEIIKYVNRIFYQERLLIPTAEEIVKVTKELIEDPENFAGNELCLIELMQERIGLS